MTEFRTEQFTHKGGRPNNEDYCGFLTLKSFACWVAADGAGGHNGGETASKTAVEAVLEAFEASPGLTSRHLTNYLEKAQGEIIKKQQAPDLSSMRTTIALLVSDYKNCMWAHAGDTRLYMFKGSRIYFQTKDHSVPQALADAGEITVEEIRCHEDRNRILKCLGAEGGVRATIMDNKVSVEKGDAFLICTDGFWDNITETEMEIDYAKSETPEKWLCHMRSRIIRRVDGEYDNYSAIAVGVG
ncbi:PP2C family protein-serine/threonine phosphatase [Candidatus Magnetominusculus xianensis]|uniref:Serine/threonine protein kinase n=1 Tax=Candidatus Magnetominusculus xianensis TaxID=1748249 RepID=A0ABR5SEM7_9BACT|nr:protein phosphatase 2C domain-containing protein [Candidatus Magnetominusculus xianensis]KWT84926.1 serine/threonine protein kinase [Candidatus Magnetominusculus xianensis]MBF0404492.1 serine/threonine-protein phosphatase [Nitrospirota bacterium]